MHELSLTQSIVELCSERAGDARVNCVTLEIGRLTCVMPNSLRFCYDVCTQGTPLQGSELRIIEIPGRARCRQCAAEVELNDWLAECACGCVDLELTSGQEMKIKSMEII